MLIITTHELWITTLFNRFLAAPASSLLNAIHYPAQDPSNPWTDWMVSEVVVVIFIVALFAALRSQLSVDKPGKLQHIFEVLYEFVHASAEEIVGHQGPRYVFFFGTLFIFILFMNLAGLIPGLESPTMSLMVPCGLAVATFCFYHGVGFRSKGAGYLKSFLGPLLVLAPLMLPIEIISNFARPLSLTIRLWANMLAGDKIYLTFISLTKVMIPVIFIGLHLFVAFLQAYIFMLLAMVYVGGAVSEEH